MKKTFVTVACALAVVSTISIATGNTKFGILGVDAVSAATTEAPAPAPKPAANPTPSPAPRTTTARPAAAQSAAYATATDVTRFLALGSYGSDVKLVQTMLNNNGYKLNVDGILGSLTEAAVKDFQSKNGLKADGVVGPLTLEKLKPAPTGTAAEIAGIKGLLVAGSQGSDVKVLQAVLNNNGYKLNVDGILGSLTEAAVKDYQAKKGLAVDGIVGPKTLASLTPAATATTASTTTPTTPTASTAPIAGQTAIKIGRVEAAAHGTKCFTVAVAAVAGDKIVAASVDDYQFVDPKQGFVGVPNSDKDFGKNYPAGLVLASKRTNTVPYSKNMMAEGATQPWLTNMTAVEKFAEGKTIPELQAAIAANKNADGTDKDATVDAVSGATFVNTNEYLQAILDAAKNAKENTSVTVDASALNTIKIGRVEAAAHGTKCFTVAVAVTAGDKIVADSVDDYQFVDPKQGFVGVPNSDKDFGKNYPAGLVLASKAANTVPYSKNMMGEGATQTWITNMTAVEKFATGNTISQLEAAITANKNADGTDKDAKVDAVTGATFVNTNEYLQAILDAAKAAK